MNRPTATPAAPRRRTRPALRESPDAEAAIEVRAVRRSDLDRVIDLDATVTGLEKRKYWLSVYRRYGSGTHDEQQFLVALARGRVVGFVIGEVRDWEFGSPPCGWVFAIDVDPQARLAGVGTQLLQAISARFQHIGVRKLRTIVALENTLILSFFRAQGMMAGPLIALEMELGP